MDYRGDNKLIQLVKHSRNEELQSFLDGTNSSSDDGTTTTLLHLVIVQNNIALIKYWLDAGYDVNAKNSNGDTPLLLALNSNNFLVVKMLLDANADVGINHNKSTAGSKTILEILMRKEKKIIDEVLPHFVDNLKRRTNVDDDVEISLFEPAIAAKCNFEHVLLMRNVQITRKYLERHSKRHFNYWSAMDMTMKRRDVDNVQVLLRYDRCNGLSAFYNSLNNLFRKNEIESWQSFIERLPHLNNVLDEMAQQHLNSYYQTASLEYLRILLNCKIDGFVKEKFGVDLRTAMFANKNVDVIELLRGQNFNVNSQGIRQQTALHFAIADGHVKNVRFLMASGANIEVRNHMGRTPLLNCIVNQSIKSGKLLLEHGANVQVIDYHGQTVFHLIAKSKNFPLLFLECLIAQLAIEHITQGLPIKREIQSPIDSNEKYKKTFETCCQQLQRLKTHEIVEYVTLYNLLTEKIEVLCRFLFDRDIIPSLLDQYKHQHELHLLYYNTMKSKLIKIANLFVFNCRMAEVISRSTGKSIDSYHLVIRNIGQYLNYHDISVFIKSNK